MDIDWSNVSGTFNTYHHRKATHFEIKGHNLKNCSIYIKPTQLMLYSKYRESHIHSSFASLNVSGPLQSVQWKGYNYTFYASYLLQTWKQSEMKCNEHGGHLASIHGLKELDVIMGFLGQLPWIPMVFVYIGLHQDLNVNNTFPF